MRLIETLVQTSLRVNPSNYYYFCLHERCTRTLFCQDNPVMDTEP